MRGMVLKVRGEEMADLTSLTKGINKREMLVFPVLSNFNSDPVFF